MRKTQVSPVKDVLLDRYAAIADAIAALLYPCAEVVIHDLHDQSIAYIVNNLSRLEWVARPCSTKSISRRAAAPSVRTKS